MVLENTRWWGGRILLASAVCAFSRIVPRTTGDVTADICRRPVRMQASALPSDWIGGPVLPIS